MKQPDVVIIGAGLAGLCCALRLQEAGVSFLVLEASDGPGGRVRTDEVDGFRLDRGFQVLLTAYPEVRRSLDLDSLELHPFLPGIMLRSGGEFFKLLDPWRVPGQWWKALTAPVGTLGDKLRIRRLRQKLMNSDIERILAHPETTTLNALLQMDFSEKMVETFWRPLLGGVMLDPHLKASSRFFEFVYKMMVEGDMALPARGMGEIPRQLARRLPEEAVRYGARVVSVDEKGVTLEDGEKVRAGVKVIAAEAPEAAKLLDLPAPISRSVVCAYFTARQSPVSSPLLILNGAGHGVVNHMCVPSVVAPGYAPEEWALISVSILGYPPDTDAQLAEKVKKHVRRWFGRQVENWKLLRIYRIHHGHPAVHPLSVGEPARLRPGLYVCGDWRNTPSINGAMQSGREAAEEILRDYNC